MPINLSKGQKVDLTKGNPGLKSIMVGLGWDVNAFDTGADLTWMQQHLCAVPTENARPKKNLSFTEIWNIRPDVSNIWATI